MLNQCYFKLNYIRTLLICPKMAYFGCFSLGGNVENLDFLEKFFKTLTTHDWKNLERPNDKTSQIKVEEAMTAAMAAGEKVIFYDRPNSWKILWISCRRCCFHTSISVSIIKRSPPSKVSLSLSVCVMFCLSLKEDFKMSTKDWTGLARSHRSLFKMEKLQKNYLLPTNRGCTYLNRMKDIGR